MCLTKADTDKVNMVIFFEKVQPALEKFLTRLGSDSESTVEKMPLHRKLLYLQHFTTFKILNSSLRMHILYVLELIKEDMRETKILNETNKSFFAAKRNMDDIQSLKEIELQDQHLSSGESSLKIQTIVKVLLLIFRNIERVDSELFEFAHGFFYENMGYFEKEMFTMCFKSYSYILYQVYIELDRKGGRGRYRYLRPYINETENRMYKTRMDEIRKKNLVLMEKMLPIVMQNMGTMCFRDFYEFLFSLSRFRFNFRHLFPFVKEIYLAAFAKYKEEVVLVREIVQREKSQKLYHISNEYQIQVPADFQHRKFSFDVLVREKRIYAMRSREMGPGLSVDLA